MSAKRIILLVICVFVERDRVVGHKYLSVAIVPAIVYNFFIRRDISELFLQLSREITEIMVAQDQSLLSIQLFQNAQPFIRFSPAKITENIDVIIIRYFFVPAADQFNFHFQTVAKRTVIKHDYI